MLADAQVVVLMLPKLEIIKIITILKYKIFTHLNHISVELQLQFMVLLIFKEPHGDFLRNDLSSENWYVLFIIFSIKL